MQDRTKAFLALVMGALCIAFAPIFAKYAVNIDGAQDGEILSPVGVAFWRMLFAMPWFMAVAWRRTPREKMRARLKARDAWLLLVPGLFFAADLSIWHWSFEFTSVANATLLANLAVVFVVLGGWLWLGESLNLPFVVGATLALAGMAGLVGFSFAHEGTAWIGDLMGFWVATMYAGYQLTTKVLLRNTPVNLMMAFVSISSSVVLLAAGALLPGRMLPVTPMAWASLVALAIVSQIMGQGFIAFGMSRLPASFASVVLILQPVLAAMLGWIMLGQELSTSQIACGCIVMVGIFVARKSTVPGGRADAELVPQPSVSSK